MQREYLTMVEPAILKAVQRVEQRHVEEADHLANGIDGEKANNHALKDHDNPQHNSQRVDILIVVLFVRNDVWHQIFFFFF